MSRLRHYLETHFALVLLLACVAGLVMPGLDRLPSASVVVALALLMFVSCYKLHDGGWRNIRWGNLAMFYAARYVALPAALWLLARLVLPAYATGIFLLAVLPAAISSPALAGIYGGAMPPAFALAIVSQLLAPLVIPLQFAWLGDVQAGPSPIALLETMVWCIVLPMSVYALTRRHHRSAAYIYRQNKLVSILLIAFVIALAIAKQRTVILTQGFGLIGALLVALGCFAVFIACGWWLGWRRPMPERITYAACSCFNNAALGVSLALLHFAPPVVLFVAVSEIGWALLPFMFRHFLAWRTV